MKANSHIIQEVLKGIVTRITYHNEESGWSVLRLQPFSSYGQVETVTVHQTKVFAGATMEFFGVWQQHPKYGRQFVANKAVEKKPATSAALEKYLGSGLIKGVGPKTAKQIVHHFGSDTLDVFESDVQRLLEVPGIAQKKLKTISEAWQGHRTIRDVMMFLQGHNISTLFAVRIFKSYGEDAITIVKNDPYRLSIDFYGIGFFSADKVALSLGMKPDCEQRLIAAIRHTLSASRDQGHCYLIKEQITKNVEELLSINVTDKIEAILKKMKEERLLMLRYLQLETDAEPQQCYYSNSLYFDELNVSKLLKSLQQLGTVNTKDIDSWMAQFQDGEISLSQEQCQAVSDIAQQPVSILTGGPGCGKTTTTKAIVLLLQHLGKKVMLAAPTGRAAQRMGEVIGQEAKTIHRLLEWQGNGFQKNAEQPLDTDFLIVDECSMLDISLTSSLLSAIGPGTGLLLIGDADQLPSVGAGNVLADIISSKTIPSYRLNKVFRQAKESKIIQYAHQINKGKMPYINSPFKDPSIWQDGTDCLFIDSEEATQEQIRFIKRAKNYLTILQKEPEQQENAYTFMTAEPIRSYNDADFILPDKFSHVNIEKLSQTNSSAQELKTVLKRLHPWSSLNYSLTAVDVVCRLYTEWIPKYFGDNCEIQILTPMTRGSLGSSNLNKIIQNAVNPAKPGKVEIQIGEKIFRVGDRVIHRKNNYELGVFNGDIGTINSIDNNDLTCSIYYKSQNSEIAYQRDDIMEIDLAYAITIHKSQGSEFQAVIMPVVTQHYTMLHKNLIYTGLTRGKKLTAMVGGRRALSMASSRQDSNKRQTALSHLLSEEF
ncbi:MAG: AAA family ATPase [Desulfotalea sp.]